MRMTFKTTVESRSKEKGKIAVRKPAALPLDSEVVQIGRIIAKGMKVKQIVQVL